jgi:hypothetical protein
MAARRPYLVHAGHLLARRRLHTPSRRRRWRRFGAPHRLPQRRRRRYRNQRRLLMWYRLLVLAIGRPGHLYHPHRLRRCRLGLTRRLLVEKAKPMDGCVFERRER